MAKKINIFNPGRGFVKSYDFSVSGLTVTPGCVFKCLYCYSPTILHTDLNTFGSGIEPKYDMTQWEEALINETPKVVDKTVYANVMTDPYQPKVASYTRAMLQSFLNIGVPKLLVLQTRSPFSARDIDLFVQFKDKIRVNFTIETNSESIRKDFTPTAPGLEARWRALNAISEAGVPVCITATPTLPFAPDSSDKSGLNLKELRAWCDRIKSLPTISHVVVQEFHNGSFTKTSPEAYNIVNNYKWFYETNGFEWVKYHLRDNLDIPVIDGITGFAPYLEINV